MWQKLPSTLGSEQFSRYMCTGFIDTCIIIHLEHGKTRQKMGILAKLDFKDKHRKPCCPIWHFEHVYSQLTWQVYGPVLWEPGSILHLPSRTLWKNMGMIFKIPNLLERKLCFTWRPVEGLVGPVIVHLRWAWLAHCGRPSVARTWRRGPLTIAARALVHILRVHLLTSVKGHSSVNL